MPTWMSLGFQDSGSYAMSEISFFHDHVITVMGIIIFFISYLMIYLLFNFKYYKFLSEGTFIETIWSIIPAFFLVVLVLPSMQVLYMMEDFKTPVFSFKIIAHQWYWSYVMPLFNNFSFSFLGNISSNYEFDSFMEVYEEDCSFPRLLGCSMDLVLPVGITSRLMISSTDVIHSFSLPVLGLKVDALPGRINQLFSTPCRVGIFYGQCSEICGSNHSFMPISLKVSLMEDFDYLGKTVLLDMFSDVTLSSVSL